MLGFSALGKRALGGIDIIPDVDVGNADVEVSGSVIAGVGLSDVAEVTAATISVSGQAIALKFTPVSLSMNRRLAVRPIFRKNT